MKTSTATVLALIVLVQADDAALRPSPAVSLGNPIKEATCAFACVRRAASEVPCQGTNLLDSFCKGFDTIEAQSKPCILKCDVVKGTAGKFSLAPRYATMTEASLTDWTEDLLFKALHLFCN